MNQDCAKPRPGYFGKMPARGDFLSGGLPRDFTDPWDDWIQTSLGQSRQQLGEQWLDVYLTSPLWCFALGPSQCGSLGWAGVLMPSVDAVGRYFPLTIAAPLDIGSNLLSLPEGAADWFAAAEVLARSSLDDGFDLDDFERQLAALGLPMSRPAPQAVEGDGASAAPLGNAWRYGMPQASQARLDCPALLHEAMGRLMYSYSLWWSGGSTRMAPSYLFCQGLPPPQGYAAMLDGAWQQWGWEDRHVFTVVDEGADDGA